jgi:hypothetical protein
LFERVTLLTTRMIAQQAKFLVSRGENERLLQALARQLRNEVRETKAHI